MESAHRIQSILRRFERARIWVLGDAMLDEYVYGDVERISPDAPVQVVHVSSTEYRLGGAINVAHGIANLGADVEFLGVVGDDASGRTLRALAEQSGIGLSALGVQDRRQTIRKVRVVAQRQHVLRLDWEVVVPVGESFAVALFEGLKARAEPPDVIVVSDYAKGLLSSQFLSKVIAWARSKQVPVLVDPKVLDYGHYAGASLIKPNRRELEAALSKTLHDDTGWYDENVRPLLRRADIDAMLVTLGEDGMALVTRAGDIRRIRAPAREVYDVTGAGDTVIGTLALARAAGCDWEEACQISNSAAGLAVAKVGTAVVSRAEIAAALSPRAQMGCVEIDALVEQIVWWRMGGKRVVFTNGCFDLLHAGHLALLRGAASFGDVLVVGLKDDASVARLTGHGLRRCGGGIFRGHSGEPDRAGPTGCPGQRRRLPGRRCRGSRNRAGPRRAG